MTWTYSGDPSANDRDEVRFLIQDTDSTDQQITDEEIAYAIANEPTNIAAAIRVCRTLAMKYARNADKTIGDLRISWSQISKRYSELAEELESSDMISIIPGVYAGGISISDKNTNDADTDRVKPMFEKNMHDNIKQEDDDDC